MKRAGTCVTVFSLTAFVAGLFAAVSAFAYDGDVDYSAPYLTLEDGKLVTKDPTKNPGATKNPDHPAQDPSKSKSSTGTSSTPGAAAGGPAQTAQETGTPPVAAMAAGAIVILAVATVVLLRVNRKRVEASPAAEYPEDKSSAQEELGRT